MFRVKTITGAALLLVMLGGSAGAVIRQWLASEGGNSHYYEAIAISTGTSVSWAQADRAATYSGGYLATITSAAENAFVFDLIDEAMYWNNRTNLRGPWIGGYQEPGADEPAGGWKWVTAELFAYANWDTGQPNDFGPTNENRLHFGNQPFRTPTWNDVPEDYTEVISYVVEYVPEPATVLLLGLGTLGLSSKRSR